jgi:hypothetical protein
MADHPRGVIAVQAHRQQTTVHPRRVTLGHPAGRESPRVTAASYEIRIRGRVGDPLLESFGGLDASVRPAETVLRGEIQDQAALHGLLDRIQSLGLELIEIRQVQDSGGTGARPR